jgi:hypothetical protein
VKKLGGTKKHEEQRKTERRDKSGLWKFAGYVVLFLVIFVVGMFVGDAYMPTIKGWVSRGAKAPIDKMRGALDSASSLASEKEINSAIDGCDDITEKEKAELKEQIAEAYKVKAEYDGENKLQVDILWEEAHKMFEEARKDGQPSGSDMRAVADKMKEAAEAAR